MERRAACARERHGGAALGVLAVLKDALIAAPDVSTPRGVFELKYFFSASIPSVQGGESHSAEAVRHRIKEMIDQENKDAVLSDDQIDRLADGLAVLADVTRLLREEDA